jgi:hypothetical protein
VCNHNSKCYLPIYKVICPSHCPLQPTPTASLQKIISFSLNFFLFIFMIPYSSTNLEFFSKLHFNFYFYFWEHVKTWVRQWVVPLHVSYTPSIFHTKNLILFFSSLFIFMIPYSSINLAFFTKRHFNIFLVFGSMSKLGLNNGLSLYMFPTPPLFSHQNIIPFFFSLFIFMIPYSSTNPAFFTKLHFDLFLVFESISKLGVENWMF